MSPGIIQYIGKLCRALAKCILGWQEPIKVCGRYTYLFSYSSGKGYSMTEFLEPIFNPSPHKQGHRSFEQWPPLPFYLIENISHKNPRGRHHAETYIKGATLKFRRKTSAIGLMSRWVDSPAVLASLSRLQNNASGFFKLYRLMLIAVKINIPKI